MRSVNKQILVGYLGKDAESTFTQGGTNVLKFSVSTNSRRKDASDNWVDNVIWFNVVAFGMESLGQYLLKGQPVYLEGETNNSSYQKDGVTKYTSEVVAKEIILLPRSEGQGQQAQRPTQQAARPVAVPAGRNAPPGPRARPAAAPRQGYAPAPAFDPGISDDDVPF